MGFLRRAFDFVVRPTQSRTMGLVVVLLLVVAVSITVYVAQQQQTLRQRAETLQVCSSIDSISPCSSSNPANNACGSEGTKCKIGSTIYECK